MLALYLAAAIVTLLQFLRLGDRRLLPLLALLVLSAAGRFFGLASTLGLACDVLACGAGLVILYALAPHHHPHRPS